MYVSLAASSSSILRSAVEVFETVERNEDDELQGSLERVIEQVISKAEGGGIHYFVVVNFLGTGRTLVSFGK
ncbi:hypothetical protein OS493_023692 [Desmophyllum pertusum]|uniref:Uncharacterized protein n=1 Tax=Desmophyllum pertusum TaxID=174260 RepID=A0A9X0CPX2_9CNID|nr:hypothetical protein OS493_023692 [Desmophyllum pertusum]